MATGDALLLAPVSAGELVDRITILQLKQREIDDPAKLANVDRELAALDAVRRDRLAPPPAGLDALTAALLAVNGRLWEIEDALRRCERADDFGARFVELARAVYRDNDERARLKRAISQLCGSTLIEEKWYPADRVERRA